MTENPVKKFNEHSVKNPQKTPDDALLLSSLIEKNSPQQKWTTDTKGDMGQFVTILKKKSPQQVLAEMDELVGMEDIKKEAQKLILRTQFDAICEIKKLKTTNQTLHTVRTGNPGTGKTVTARLWAELLYSLDLAGPRYAEVSREKVIAGYIGQTEGKALELINTADQIFIDEAYNMVLPGDTEKKDFGTQIVNALMTAMENNRDSLVVSFAGYPDEMEEFIASNPGLSRRIPHRHNFPDYTIEQLGEIMDRNLAKAGRKIDEEAKECVLKQLAEIKKAVGERNFGNAGLVRTIVEQLPNEMAERLFGQEAKAVTSSLIVAAPSDEDLVTVRKSDVEGLNLIKKMVPQSALKKTRKIGFHRDEE